MISMPINKLFLITQKWYLPMWKKDKIIYFAFAPFYYLLIGLNFIFDWLCSKLVTHIN
jgi:hypothetical protein